MACKFGQMHKLSASHRCTDIAGTAHMQVWDYDRSAEQRDTEGGASRRSVLEQAEKLKHYLVQQELA